MWALVWGMAAVVGLGALAGAEQVWAQGKDISGEGKKTEHRVALIIGNASYAESPLNNPANDVRGMAQALRAHGFEVIERVNADNIAMRRAVAQFGESLRDGGVGLFYYSGHGMQVNGRNYLVPIGAKIPSENYVSAETLDVDSVLGQMDAAKSRVNVVILDACRNNPFARRFRSPQRGLAFMQAPVGTFIAYATSPGDVADDGDPGTYGIFTGELLKAIREPGLKIEDVFKRVGLSVQQRTNRRQTPWVASNLTGDFSFDSTMIALVPPIKPRLEGREEIRREFGSLTLRGLIPGADVWLGDQKVWTTKSGATFVISNVPVGTHQIVARKVGHKEWEREIQVTANTRAEVVIDIETLGPHKVIKGEDGAEMLLVPAGEFWMGSDSEDRDAVDNEKLRRRVYLDAFHIDKYELTYGLYGRFLTATGRPPPAFWNNRPSDHHPVVGINWYDAAAYCAWAGKRLATEAEWEKAARGTDGRRYPWGDSWDPAKANRGRPKPVGSHPGGESPYGAHDMIGNVWEWVADWYEAAYYRRAPSRNPPGPDSGSSKVMRGGPSTGAPPTVRATTREYAPPGSWSETSGARCAKVAS